MSPQVQHPGATREIATGDQLGAFRLDALADEGGMGRVFRAVHVKLNRTVAIKILRRKYSARPENIARFFQEARAVNVIRHPGIVEITDFFEAPPGGDSYYVMEWLDGETVGKRLERGGPFPTDDVVRIARQVASALAAAHRAGFVHRDVTPGNLFLLRGTERLTTKVLDFGVATLEGSADDAVAGTPSYFSPECAAGRGVDARSDIYSLGVVLYQLLAGVPPFQGNTVTELAMKHMTARPRPLGEVAPSVPHALAAAIDRCLKKKPGARFQSMEELELALATLNTSGAPSVRRRHVAGAVAGATLAIGALAAGVVGMRRPPRPSVTAAMLPPDQGLAAKAVATTPSLATATSVDDRVAVSIASEPTEAEVYRAGAVIGVTPCTVRLPPGALTLELRREGFRPTALALEARRGAAVSVKLEALASAKHGQSTRRPSRNATRNATIDPFADKKP